MIRRAAFVLVPLLLAATPAPKPKPAKKPIVLGDVVVDGKKQVPVGFVMTRDASVKQALDAATDQHLMESVRR